MSTVTKIVKTTRIESEEGLHELSHGLWIVKVIFQGLLAAIIYAAFLYYFGMVSILGACYECMQVLSTITNPVVKFVGFLSDVLLVSSFKASEITFQTQQGSLTRIAMNAASIWFISCLFSFRFKVNVRTLHVLALSILMVIFLATALFILASVSQGNEQSGLSYLLEFLFICVIFAYAASVKSKNNTESSSKDVVATLLSIVMVAALVMLPLIKFAQ